MDKVLVHKVESLLKTGAHPRMLAGQKLCRSSSFKRAKRVEVMTYSCASGWTRRCFLCRVLEYSNLNSAYSIRT